MLFLLRAVVLLVGTLLAAYTDKKTGLILDKITYPMIGLGIIFNLLEFDLGFFVLAGIVFAIGYVLYWLGKLGGGDVKLLAGIALLLPFYNEKIFIVHMLLVAAITSIVFYSAYYLIKYWKKGIDLRENKDGIMSSAILFIAICFFFFFMATNEVLDLAAIAILFVAFAFALVFLALEKGIKRNFFLKEIPIEKLEEDEVLATEFLGEKQKEALGLKFKGIVGEQEKQKLKKAGIQTVPVYREMPVFAPFIFLGTAIALAFPDLLGTLIF